MRRIFYLAGGFNFTYEQFNENCQVLLNDYRAKILQRFGIDPNELIGRNWLPNSGKYCYTEYLNIPNGGIYIGPFYFYEPNVEHPSDQQLVVWKENQMIEHCTDAVFFITRDNIPGTVVEMVHAANAGKKIHIFYIPDFDGTMSGHIDSRCWYPIEFCLLTNPDNTFVTKVSNEDEFINNLEQLIRNN